MFCIFHLYLYFLNTSWKSKLELDLTERRVAVTIDRVAGSGIREMAEIYSPRHYSEIYYPPHYRAGSTDPETHCIARCRTAMLQTIPSPAPVQCHRHHNPKLSSILASAANSIHTSKHGCANLVAAQRAALFLYSSVQNCSTVVFSVQSWWSPGRGV